MKSAHERTTARLDRPEIFLQAAIHKGVIGIVFEFGYAKDSTIRIVFNPILGIVLCISKWDYFPL
jgi:hypothetical protein